MIVSLQKNYGIVIAGHGSRDQEGVKEFEALIDLIKETSPRHLITHGFLEFAKPTIDEAVRIQVAAGVERIAVVPGVLLAASHAKNDMPSEVLALQREFPAVSITYGAPLHLHPLVLQVLRKNIIATEAQSDLIIRREDTCLVVVGRGTTDSDANSDVAKLTRMLEEGMGFGAAGVCYSGTAKPLVADGLSRAGKLGFKRLLVVPFFLFTGILIKRIAAAIVEFSERHPDVEVLNTGHLGTSSSLARAFLERAAESIEGKAAMNCSLCKYRVQVIGYEKEVGAPQQGHHFHVRGGIAALGTSPALHLEKRNKNAMTPHPIEVESFRLIRAGRDWNNLPEAHRFVLQRLVHTSGDFGIVDDIFISPGALTAGMRALQQRARILTDVTMVQSGLRRSLIEHFSLETICCVHDEETRLLAEANKLTRSAAGIRRAWMQFGNNLVVAIGDAPTAVEEAVRLVLEQQWRPHLIIGLPVGFVGTQECKERLRQCLRVPRITNRGTRGGSPWAAAVINAMLLQLAGQIP